MRALRKASTFGVSLTALLLGCGDTSQSGEGALDASQDCARCEYLAKGIVFPYAPHVVGDQVFVEDWGAAKLLKVPLAGGRVDTVFEGLKPRTFAVTRSDLYFVAPDATDRSFAEIWRVPLGGGDPKRYARYRADSDLPLGVYQGTPFLKGEDGDGGTRLARLEADGSKVTVRQWSPGAEPLSHGAALLEDGQLIWGDPEKGLWSAGTPDGEGRLDATGLMVSRIDVTPQGVLVTNYPELDVEKASRVFVRRPSGELEEVAVSRSERIGAPAVLVSSGVVAQSPETGRLLLHTRAGDVKEVAASQGRLSMNPEGLAASTDHVVFLASLGADDWSLYRAALPQ
jgi:hypothetical protein